MAKVVYSVRLSPAVDRVIQARAAEAKTRPSTFLASFIEQVLLADDGPEDQRAALTGLLLEMLWRLELLTAVEKKRTPAVAKDSTIDAMRKRAEALHEEIRKSCTHRETLKARLEHLR